LRIPKDYKQTIEGFPFRVFIVLLAVAVFFFVFQSVSFAPTKLPENKPHGINTKPLTDEELSDINAQALFRLTQYTSSYGTGSSNVIRLDLGVQQIMNAHIDSFKMGYYTNLGGNTGWDNDTTNYFWGGTDFSAGIPSTTLTWNNMFLELGFDNIGNNATRTLNYIDFGTSDAVGQITGTINVITGLTQGGTGTNSGVLLRQTASGTRIVNFEGENLSFVFANKYRFVGSAGTMDNLQGIFLRLPNYHTTNDLSRP